MNTYIKSIPYSGIHIPADLYQKLHKYRVTKLSLFLDCLVQYDDFNKLQYNEKILLVKSIEKACYNYTITKSMEKNIMSTWENDIFCDVYHSTCYKISSNIDKTFINNDKFALSIINKTINIDDLPNISSKEIFPELYEKIEDDIKSRSNIKQTVKVTKMYKCSRCKQKQCTIQPRYNRSLDEGVNLIITCQNCKHEWNA
jgi:DNA-directed RNA polymerase subunit M/transcription elongation factor TFIIS